MTNPIKYFLDNFGKVPEPRPPIIPGPWRIPFFAAVSIVSLAVLVLLVTYVVIPAIQSQPPAAPVSSSAPAK